MKMFILLLLVLTGFAFSQPLPPTEVTDAPDVVADDPCVGGYEKVKPGEETTNRDGVTVANDKESSGDATIDPKGGCGKEGSKTKVKTKTGFEGSISGLDGNDSVDMSSGADATVSGSGGDVTISNNSEVTVTNAAGGGNMTVHMPSGSEVTIPPGSSATFST